MVRTALSPGKCEADTELGNIGCLRETRGSSVSFYALPTRPQYSGTSLRFFDGARGANLRLLNPLFDAASTLAYFWEPVVLLAITCSLIPTSNRL